MLEKRSNGTVLSKRVSKYLTAGGKMERALVTEPRVSYAAHPDLYN